MYNMYCDYCDLHKKEKVKEYLYRHIFNTEFNIEFQKPKKDRCDLCEEFKMKGNDLTGDAKVKYESHVAGKLATKEERDRDRGGQTIVVCFDLENVFSLPKANVSNFFYKRKLNVYNLTAHCSVDKQAYCSIWNEAQSGRGCNDIASALVAILKKVVETHPTTDHIILWSDSCVPQNRNSAMSMALMDFLQAQPTLSVIEQKYCQPGHSTIQEVDNIHSQIERAFRAAEIYSPLSLVRQMIQVNKKKPFKVIQMQPTKSFYNFQTASKTLDFKKVPFASVRQICYTKSKPLHLKYKKMFGEPYVEVALLCEKNTRGKCKKVSTLPHVRTLEVTSVLSDAKRKDIQSMLKFMPTTDQVFMKTLIQKSSK